MWVSSKLLCLYAFSATANADTYMGQPLKFYKGMRFPWNIKEAPESYDHTIPTVNYTWDWYFEYLVKSGADSFQLGGYAIEESKVVLEPDFYDPWNITGFMSLRKQVDAAGGEILADTRFYLDYGNNTFDKATFLKSASEFLKDYPVDGFQVGLSLPTDPKQYQPLKELIEAIKELNVRACLE
ncbi:hypothetical protein Pmar_PMAR018396 [Perkinsus marinus ATCC 50983]|uniref:Uncharacterized protein n=1 Tax=Perkinsus marinus (strain ATCC 50983 / TXsc) TaxID=423536 RepID=C5LJE1_PERM5|nr:hypothetical protein Pmar_PMAR018396 [Perkinsus marinus ATCC 50983]EER03141.1 hypothetical protein Pmar_PMAR018396 [Perkinsus marinus ATCC 50983]|eukprot:XP_002771325.1 hypothetical protein Pmar_PMAR018396 [Perkinsus marinus ATCC 50983]